MGRTKYMMTIEDLASHPIEIQISRLSFGELGDDNGLIRSAFMIERIADQWSPSLQQTNSTGQQMQVSIRQDVLGDWGHLLKRTIYSFSNTQALAKKKLRLFTLIPKDLISSQIRI